MPTAGALQMASDAEMDLVEINATNIPPIVKIMDYGKFKYEQKKKAAEARKNQKQNELKEMYIKPFIEDNDLGIKMKKVLEFLVDGDKVKVSITMRRGDKKVLARGRDFVPALLQKIAGLVGENGTIDGQSKPDDRTKYIIFAPAKK
jgi:translation initiation factor IF-3